MNHRSLLLTLAGSSLLPFSLLSCSPSGNAISPETSADLQDARRFPFGDFKSNVPHAPKLAGYRQVPSRSTAMRDAEIDHPSGKWTYSYDLKNEKRPITITSSSGKTTRLGSDFYPDEGGADAAGVYAFVKGDETVIVLQGTSDVTYEETHIKFKGDAYVDARKYGVKGGGMGPEMPGEAPKYPVYPPN